MLGGSAVWPPRSSSLLAHILYMADGITGVHDWRPSIFMPHKLSRITLGITAVRIEEVQDVSEDDARAEGFESISAFADYWDSINGEGAWDRNDWVWVIEFKRIEDEGRKS